MPPKRRKAKQAVEDQDYDMLFKPSQMKVPQLKDELTKRGLPATGKRAELVARLENSLAGASASKAVKTEVADEEEVKEEEDAGKSTFSKAVAALKKSGHTTKKCQHKVDKFVPLSFNYEVSK